ncbi:MAG: sulfotransferase [Steroidobacteraceae bacterium]
MANHTASRRVGLTPEIAFNRAVALQFQGNLGEAEKLYRAILKEHPRHVPTLFNLAAALCGAGRSGEAVRVLRKALEQEPDAADAHALLARAFLNLDCYDEALKHARQAIALNPHWADAHAALASWLADMGRYEEALRAQARAIELDPDQPRHYYHWGYITRWTADDPRLTALQALAKRSGSRPLVDRVHLKFALAKAYADCGDVERAFRHQIEGGALKRQMIGHKAPPTLRAIDALCRELNAEWMRRHQGVGDASPLPVFIVGMPRSGSTLVEQILASHPKVHTLGERAIFNEALVRVCESPVLPQSLAREAARWSGAKLRRLGRLYLESAQRDAPASATRISDKMLSNFRFAGLIHAALPNARLIHTCRDRIDTCLSIFSILFSGDAHPYSYDLGELGRFYCAYEKAMAHWRNVLPADVMLEVQYEQTVEDVERQARRIIAHCGLEWDEACLAFYRTERPIRTASHAQVREPIYRDSIGRQHPPRELLLPLLRAFALE